jgi:PAS domain S-box-containing protein
MQQDLKDTLKETRNLPFVAALVLMVAGLGITWLAHRQVELSIRNESSARFNEQFERVHASVQAQFEQPLRGLDGLKGLFAAVAQVKPAQFKAWVQSQDLLQNYAGAQGFGFLERSSSTAPYQFRYLEPRPLNVRDWELQLETDPTLREAALRSVSSDAASLVRMDMGGEAAALRADFLLMAPIFKNGVSPIDKQERQEALLGILFTPILAEELLITTLAVTEGTLNFEIIDDAGPDQQVLLFSSSSPIHANGKREVPRDFQQRPFFKSQKLVIGGHKMRLHAGSSPLFESQLDRTTPVVIATTGSVLSLLLAIIFWLVLQGRERARSMAQSMTKDLDRLARVVKSTSHIVVLGDKHRNITWVNDAFIQFTQMPLDVVVGINFAELFRMDDTDQVSRAQFRAAMDKHEGVRMQMPWRTQAGQQHWFDVDLQTELDASGAFTGYIAIASDITVQRNANDQIAAALQENKQLMDAIDQHSIVSITDHQGRITYVNNMFCEVSGYSEAELLGANHRIVKSAYQNDAFWESMWKTISSGYPWRATVCNQAKDGSLYWVDSVIAPFFDENGIIEKYVSIRTDVTPARTAQLALANEREHLAAILDGTDAGTWEWDVPKEALLINERWAAMLGYTRQSLGTLTLKKWRALCHPEDLPRVQAMRDSHYSGESASFSCEIRMQHQEGHWVWILMRGKVTTWITPGKPHWVSGIHLDISSQKALESELQQKNMLMESILSNIPVALSVFNSDLNLIAKNDKFLELLDFPKWLFERPAVTFESLIRLNALRGEYGTGEVEQAVQSIIERARHTEPHQFERVRPNGLALEVRGAPMPGGGFITTYADISARKQAEAAIVESQRLLQSVLDAASEVAIISLGSDGLITLFNKGAEHLLGYHPDEVVGKMSPGVFFDTSELQARNSALSVHLGKTLNGLDVLVDDYVLGKRTEWQLVHKDGHQFTAAIVMTAMTNDAGEHTGYLGVSHDVTQEKKNEQALQMAVTLAEQAALSKGQFLANMSHEIRTPMNAILGMLKLLQNTELDARQQDYASKTENAARSLLGLLNDILDFSKAEAGKMTLDPQPFALDQIMRDLSVILSANIGNKGIEILFDIDPAIPPSLLGDALRLQQVLINLAGNAIKFTQQGEVLLSVALVDTVNGLAHIQFKVRDSGIGIAPENQQHIFSGFSQAEASTTRRFGGTGLGLAISQRLVAMMGGALELTSVLGQGSTFFFTVVLPVDATRAPRTLVTSSATPAGAKPTLVVDDNALARDILARMARAQGWQVDVASSAEDAVACLRARQQKGLPGYETVLMDWQMPGMDGWEAAQLLRATDKGPAVPVVLMVTAHQREQLSQRSEIEQRSLDGFLVKPITASMLAEAVAEAQSKAGNPTQRTPAKSSKTKQLTGMRILVVEDNPINQQVAKELLRAEGALVEIADNGALGVEAVRLASPAYHVVLMDLQMPVMDGYTASVEIRHTLGMTDLPIIAMTANAMASDRETCLAAGMNDHIGKPFDLNKLIALLLQHTQYQPPEVSEAQQETPAKPLTLNAQDAAIAQALERLGGNEALFAQVVNAFLIEISTLAQQFDRLLASQDAGGLTRVLHTYKGLSLTVGATMLSEACASAEQIFKALPVGAPMQDSHTFADSRVHILEAVAQTTHMYGTLITPVEHAPVVRLAPLDNVDSQALAHALQALLPLLRGSDLQVLEDFQQLLDVYGVFDALDPLQSAIASFDFSAAVVQCEKLVQQLQHPATP